MTDCHLVMHAQIERLSKDKALLKEKLLTLTKEIESMRKGGCGGCSRFGARLGIGLGPTASNDVLFT